jgi:methionyl-tRNA formyltransferase
MTSIIVTNRGEGDITKREDFTPEKLRTFWDLDYVFIPFWSWWIPPEIYENWECVIFHMTDLPYGRGGSPLQNLIVRGHRRTMISAIKCVKEIDAGPIYLKRGLNIFYGTADEIYDRADKEIRDFMIPYILKHKPEPKPQEGEPTYFEKWKCNKEDVVRAMETNYEWQ